MALFTRAGVGFEPPSDLSYQSLEQSIIVAEGPVMESEWRKWLFREIPHDADDKVFRWGQRLRKQALETFANDDGPPEWPPTTDPEALYDEHHRKNEQDSLFEGREGSGDETPEAPQKSSSWWAKTLGFGQDKTMKHIGGQWLFRGTLGQGVGYI